MPLFIYDNIGAAAAFLVIAEAAGINGLLSFGVAAVPAQDVGARPPDQDGTQEVLEAPLASLDQPEVVA